MITAAERSRFAAVLAAAGIALASAAGTANASTRLATYVQPDFVTFDGRSCDPDISEPGRTYQISLPVNARGIRVIKPRIGTKMYSSLDSTPNPIATITAIDIRKGRRKAVAFRVTPTEPGCSEEVSADPEFGWDTGSAKAAVEYRAPAPKLYIKARSNGRVPTLGHFHPSRSPHFRAAFRVFGEPSSESGDDDFCRVRWATIGLTILFANFGIENACDLDGGLAQYVVIKGPEAKDWLTVPGLRIGNRVRRLRRLYPQASRHGKSWWLVTGRTRIACERPAGCPYPVLRASIRRGRVDAFRVWVGAAGD
jgi:hypothetical protein